MDSGSIISIGGIFQSQCIICILSVFFNLFFVLFINDLFGKMWFLIKKWSIPIWWNLVSKSDTTSAILEKFQFPEGMKKCFTEWYTVASVWRSVHVSWYAQVLWIVSGNSWIPTFAWTLEWNNYPRKILVFRAGRVVDSWPQRAFRVLPISSPMDHGWVSTGTRWKWSCPLSRSLSQRFFITFSPT